MIFFWNFRIVPATKTLFFCFHRLAKPTALTPAVMTNCYASCYDRSVYWKGPWVDISTTCSFIVFIAKFFPWINIGRCQSTEVREFFVRLTVIGKSAGIIISHAVDAIFLQMVIKIKRKIYLSDTGLIPLKCWKLQTSFWWKCCEIVWNKKCNHRQL